MIFVLGYNPCLDLFVNLMKTQFNCQVVIFEEAEFLRSYKSEILQIYSQAYEMEDLVKNLYMANIVINIFPKYVEGQMIASKHFFKLDSQTILINLGTLDNIDIFALIEALELGRIHGCWCDVPESVDFNQLNPLYSVKNLMMSVEGLNSNHLILIDKITHFVSMYEEFTKGNLDKIKGKYDTKLGRLIPETN